MTKSKLRSDFLAQRRSLKVEDRNSRTDAIIERFFGKFDLESIRVVHCYRPITKNSEFETDLILDQMRSRVSHLVTAVPRVSPETNELEHIRIQENTIFETGAFGIPEPVNGEKIDEKIIDLVIVPLLSFDRNGHRVGYGAGYYDRFLAKCRPDCIKIGLSFFEPVEKIEDIHENDVRLDFCVTADKVYDFSLTIDH